MELINENLIKVDALWNNRQQVIEEIADLLFKENRIKEKEGFIKDVYLREAQMSTSMGLGVAIPHTQSKYVKYPTLTFMRLKEEIEWNDDANVRLIFGIAVPENKGCEDHLRILSHLARKLMDEKFRRELEEVKTIQEGYAILQFINQ